MSSHDHDHDHDHDRGHVHLDEADWAAWATQTELEGDVLLDVVTDTLSWAGELRGPEAPAVRRVLDIGSGPGVGACEAARLFPDAFVVAVDSSPAMLERATLRAARLDVGARIGTHLAELPAGLEGLEPADVIWASMSLHHVGDEVAALRALGALLAPNGLIAIAEFGDPTRVLPDDLGIGEPGLADRLEPAGAAWFAQMREGLTDSVPSADLPSMVVAAGLEVVGSRLARVQLAAPLADDARRLVRGHLLRLGQQVGDGLYEGDRHILDVLTDPEDPRGVMHRSDVFVDASRQVLIARA
jgi:SAM-dependent methyltransferase